MYKYWIQTTWKIKGKNIIDIEKISEKKLSAAFKKFFQSILKEKYQNLVILMEMGDHLKK